MVNPILPKAQSHISETSREPTREWYEFFRRLLQFIQESGADPGVIASILERLDELEQEDNTLIINGLMSVDVSGTPEAGVVQIKLDGDIELPGTSYYYGTNAAGVKSFYRVRDAEVDHLSGSTYSTIQQFIDTMHSPGTIDGPTPVIMESGIPATPIRVLAGKGMIRVADDDVSSMPFFNWSQTDFAQASDGLTRFYGVVYNGGSPIVQQRTTYNWDKDTEIPLGSAVIFSSGVVVITANPYKTGDPITNIIQRFDAQSPAIRDASLGGLIIGETGTRNVTLSGASGGGPAKIWSRLSDYDVSAKNSSTAPMLSAFFNGTGLTVASGLTQWDNTRYNNVGAGTLVAMGANKYANLWFFISIDGTKWGWAYGTNEYNTLGAAANEGVPVYLNTNFFQQALLLGRLIFQQGAATAALIESAFTQLFNTAAINNHNDLNGLQDAPNAVANQHYHASLTQATDLSVLSTGGTSGQFWRGDKGYNNTLLYGGATIPSPSAGVKIVSQNNTQSQLFEVITTGAGSTVGADICSTAYEDAGGGGLMHVRRARGTLASPSAVLAGDIVGGISGRSYHSGGAFQSSGPASIHWVASENQTPTAFGSYMRFFSTPQGSTTRVERLVLTDVGATWSLGSGTFDPKSATQTQPFGTNTHRFLASAVGEASRITSIGYGASGTPQINLAHANGTPAAPTAVLSGDQIGLISCIGHTGSTWVSAGLFRYQASENWTPTANGVDLIFETVANGSASRTEKLRLWNDGRLSGTSLHNNAGTVTGTTDQFIASGTWTPVLTNTTNITASSSSVCQWTRVGNVVNFSGRVTIDPTATGLIQLGASLPIASNFTAVEQAGGTGASNNEFFRIYADATNDRLMFESIIKADVASAGFHFSGSYLIA